MLLFTLILHCIISMTTGSSSSERLGLISHVTLERLFLLNEEFQQPPKNDESTTNYTSQLQDRNFVS